MGLGFAVDFYSLFRLQQVQFFRVFSACSVPGLGSVVLELSSNDRFFGVS